MASIVKGKVIYANTKRKNQFGNYQLQLIISDTSLLDDELKAKVKIYEDEDQNKYPVISVTSKFPIELFDNNGNIIEEEVGKGTIVIAKLSLDTRFSKKGAVRLEAGKVKHLVEFTSKATEALKEINNSVFDEEDYEDDLPF